MKKSSELSKKNDGSLYTEQNIYEIMLKNVKNED